MLSGGIKMNCMIMLCFSCFDFTHPFVKLGVHFTQSQSQRPKYEVNMFEFV